MNIESPSASHVRSYVSPKRWYDLVWLRDRNTLISFFDSGAPLRLDLQHLEWIDLQPLVDLLLHIDQSIRSGQPLEVVLPGQHAAPWSLRALRFLSDTGFLSALAERNAKYSGRLGFIRDSVYLDPGALQEALKQSMHTLPPRALKYAVLIPCLIVDTSDLKSRLQVFDFCHKLKIDHLRGKPRQLDISANLVYQSKVFLDSVLPELIDNVRIHKPRDSRTLALFSRLRKREERLFHASDVVEAPWAEMTALNKRTQHLWQFDVAEAAVADSGPGIQESWLTAWHRNHGRNSVPRLPESNARIDGPNADTIILQGVFAENMSSLTAKERQAHDLPTVLTGLRSIRDAIHSQDWHFSVRSGANYVVFSSGLTRDETAKIIPRETRRYERSPGVQYLFRFADQVGQPLKKWSDAVPTNGVERTSEWWFTLPDGSTMPFVTFQYQIPDEAKGGDVMLCRPAHCIAKGLLLRFLRSVGERGVRLIFCDIPEPIALHLHLLIRDLKKYDGLDLVVPIVTNTWRVAVPGEDARFTRSFLRRSSDAQQGWWSAPGCVVGTVADVMRHCREFDSRLFWEAAHADSGAFLREPVRWSDDLTLIGGYLSFANATRIPAVRKIVRRSVVLAAHALRLSRIVASSEAVKHLASEVTRHLSGEGVRVQTGILGSVRITGASLEASRRSAAAAVVLPVFQYPVQLTTTEDIPAVPISDIRALEWSPQGADIAEGAKSRPAIQPRFSRLGRTERIRLTPDRPLRDSAIQSPETAYRTWQRYDLIRIGHFSGSYHHHLVWLDLVTFLQGRSPESMELIAVLASRIDAYDARAIFYEPNEAAEELLELLTRYATEHKLPNFPKYSWPTSVVLDYSHLPTGNVGSITEEARPNNNSPAKAVFLDSIRVSGHLSARVRAHLLALGYTETLDVVILDRAQDVESDLGHQKLVAWWSLSAPRLGSPRSCSLCRGSDAVSAIAAHTRSRVFSAAISGWASFWTMGGDGGTGVPLLRDSALLQLANRKLGDWTLSLSTHHALMTWTMELVSRLRYFSYVCERSDRPDLQVRTAIEAALLLHYWHELHAAYQKTVFLKAIEALWAEDDPQRRSLLVLALASLSRQDLRQHIDVLRNYLVKNGVPNLDVALAAYALIHMAHSDRATRMSYIAAMRVQLSAGSLPLQAPWRRSRALLSLWTASTGGELRYRSAMRIVGIPGRGLRHAYLYDLLDGLARDEHALREILDETCALLEAVREVVEQMLPTFERHEVARTVEKTFKAFFEGAKSYRISPTDQSVQQIRFAATKLIRYLSVDIHGAPNVRQILATQYIHYVPLVIRESVARLSRTTDGSGVEVEDFDISPQITDAEAIVLSSQIEAEKRAEAVQQLQELDVVCVDRSYLEQLISDLLLDMQHPKAKGLKQISGAYMSVNCTTIKPTGKGATYQIKFTNRADEADWVAASTSRSFTIARYFAGDLGGMLGQEFTEGEVRRILTLPMFALSRSRR